MLTHSPGVGFPLLPSGWTTACTGEGWDWETGCHRLEPWLGPQLALWEVTPYAFPVKQ